MTPTDPLDQVPQPHPDAAREQVGGRTMVATGDDRLHYFVQGEGEEPSEVAERILALADGTRSVRQIAQALTEEFEVDLATAQADAVEFVQQLVAAGVLRLKD